MLLENDFGLWKPSSNDHFLKTEFQSGCFYITEARVVFLFKCLNIDDYFLNVFMPLGFFPFPPLIFIPSLDDDLLEEENSVLV